MGKIEKPREYFEYYGDFLIEVNRSREETNVERAEHIAQSLFEIIKRTLETSVASSVEKKSILKGFAETIRTNIEELHELPESDKIETQPIVFNKLAEKLAESIHDETSTKIFQKYEEQLQEILAATKPQELAQDVIFLSESEVEKPPIELDESSIDVDTPVFSAADRAIDPITRAIRVRILTKQRELIVTALVEKDIVQKGKIDDINKFREYFENEQNKETISELLKDKNLKQALEQVEIIGYKNVHTDFGARFTTMEWQDGTVENGNGITTKKQVVRDANNNEIATLAEATHKINPPHIVQKSDGSNVTINNYRTIDFPITLEKRNGPMHLSLAVKDQNGKNIAASKAVYFTAHYDDDGKLVEVSSPHPVKFNGNNPDAVGYIEHGGQIYTLPVTQEKYKAMMQEVAKNLGHGVNISQSINEPLSVDLVVTSRKDSPNTVGHIKPGEQILVTQEEHKATMQENLEQRVDISQSIDAPDLMVTPKPDIAEAQLHKVQENMVPIDIVKREEVVLKIEEKTTEQAYYDTPKISRAMLINSDVRDRTESIRASLSPRYISSPARKPEANIEKLVGELSKNLEGKELENQKKDIGATLEELTPQEKIKLLQGLSKAVAENRGEELKKIGEKQRKPDADPVRLVTENKETGKDGGVVKPQRKADHANIKDNARLQTFLLDKINEVSKKASIASKTRGAGSPGF